MENTNAYDPIAYAAIIARNILSGANTCKTLERAVEQRDQKYFINAALPVIQVKCQELSDAIAQRDKALATTELLRFALETVGQNLISDENHPEQLVFHMSAAFQPVLEQALGRKLG